MISIITVILKSNDISIIDYQEFHYRTSYHYCIVSINNINLVFKCDTFLLIVMMYYYFTYSKKSCVRLPYSSSLLYSKISTSFLLILLQGLIILTISTDKLCHTACSSSIPMLASSWSTELSDWLPCLDRKWRTSLCLGGGGKTYAR